ncbi:putative secreted protein [Wickerhamomyces ciferrii]|uniref:Secreted protein n=1 Tax=Wickerhamomyces ciferrii (strain ATCC 14091 / BCRC 22168 / CBS 111 / JCM 3599 / NBRC 0793 / NRRL Y-1031 F-60-10) TaxID=1206466 RepID=K0KY71_WICCF|nr:uncharacterized protein BN7_6631 [Wickerhamomyces ciferrii]CCH47022.1 putative secreted protein [Wickerhamomyces ciferrii]
MKLSTTVLVQTGLLLSCVTASSVTFTPDAAPDALESPKGDNSTDGLVGAEGYNTIYNLCFDANKSKYCYKNSVKGCAAVYKHEDKLTDYEATTICSFWCSKIKTSNDCKTKKKKLDYAPLWACDDQKYCS